MIMPSVNPKELPEVNIGVVGHVAHGKSTLVHAITGKLTLKHSEELKRGITIRLGYADATIYKCPKCGKYSTSKKCPFCFSDTEIQRTISFVDAPGHEALMATVLTGARLMDGAILVIAADKKCPQPQAREHVVALQTIGIKNLVVVQNKIDKVSKERVLQSYEEIKEFLANTPYADAPIIPISAAHRVNIEYVLEAIEKYIPTPKRDPNLDPLMLIARSFDVNKPGTRPGELKGGVLGGSLLQGKFKIGDEIEIRPGIIENGKAKPLTTEIVGLQKKGIDLEEAGPGGLLGVMTKLDPSLTRADALVGNVVGRPGKLPEIRYELSFEIHLLERVVGLEDFRNVEPIKQGEKLLINAGTARTVAIVTKLGDIVEAKLALPIAIKEKERIAISRNINGRWRLIGYGVVY